MNKIVDDPLWDPTVREYLRLKERGEILHRLNILIKDMEEKAVIKEKKNRLPPTFEDYLEFVKKEEELKKNDRIPLKN
jgi:hypothetical protein